MLSPGPNPFKDAALAGSGPLAGFSLLSCVGAEAGAFLQAQTMNDLRALAPGRWQWNGWLTPKGRVVCLFALWRRDDHDFLAILPDFPAAELQPLLQRYVFRSKLKLAVEESWTVHGEFGGVPDAGTRDLATARGTGWSLDFGGEAAGRRLVLLPRGDAAGSAEGAAFDAAWRDADFLHGFPRLDQGQREAWTPQMLSLQRLQAFSLAKGCYPGQEIVARTHYLGQAKRELVLLEGEDLAAAASVKDADGAALGTIVCAGRDGRRALAVLAAERAPGTRVAGPGTAVERMLAGGLQRPA